MPTDNERALNIDLIKRSFAYNHHTGEIKRTLSYGRALVGQTFEEAAEAYRKAAAEHHGEFACHD